jgi:type I restriction enzyme, R subunit
LYDLAVWIDYCYGSLEDDKIKFNEELIPKGKIFNEEKVVLSYENNSVENSVEKIKEVPTKKHTIPVTQKTTSEKETRIKYIDVMLKKAGWKLEDKNVREYPVEGISSKTGAGKVDYVLWGDDGTPLAVIEVKKTARDPREGREQVQQYAEAIEKKFNFYPVRFCTNGFETYIYDDKEAVERKIYGFYRKEELIRIISRRKNKIDEKVLLEAIDNNIAGRPYQRRAITKVLENYNNGNRKSLLVMATGSGKTRVSASIVSTLSNLNLINRTLFLADRVALVKQAMNSFKIYLPDFTLCNLVEEKNRDNVKVLFSTYQTMAAEAEKLREDGTNKYGIGAFDLIIVDEAHRSVYQKYGDLFEYFDSLLLGLTATPKIFPHLIYFIFNLSSYHFSHLFYFLSNYIIFFNKF